MKPIETSYKGYRFRSRLEARWAVFFEALGIRWEYEPEGFETRTGRWLPDFYLPDHRKAYIDVKHADASEQELMSVREKAYWLQQSETGSGLLLIGSPWTGDYRLEGFLLEAYDGHCINQGEFSYGLANESHLWITDKNESFSLATLERSDRRQNNLHQRLIAAFTAARSARFEFGESGAPR
jgi:hypothetical protein